MNKYLNFIIGLAILSLVSCSNKQTPPALFSGSEDEDETEQTVTAPVSPTAPGAPQTSVGPQNSNIPQIIYDIWSYAPQTVNIPAETTMEQAICSTYPNLRRCYGYTNVGGAKLIGEMSADKAGHNYSFFSYPITLQVMSLPQLRLGFISNQDNIMCHVVNQELEIQSADIIYTGNGLGLEMDVRNRTGSAYAVTIERGQMVEAKDNHVQNVVVNADVEGQLTPNGSRHFSIPVYCASHYRSSPTGSKAKMTPYVMNASSTTFQSQQRVWEFIESNDNPNSFVTFYVWGKGTVTAAGRRSPLGHAFIKIPQVGILGFGSMHGGLLDDDGIIFDHTSNLQYATDSCRIKLSREAQQAMVRKLRQLQADVPNYSAGHYDCTSFVMDLADAAGIRYGSRITIQTPVGFMQELKAHNNYAQ